MNSNPKLPAVPMCYDCAGEIDPWDVEMEYCFKHDRYPKALCHKCRKRSEKIPTLDAQKLYDTRNDWLDNPNFDIDK